jgi:hypothetical protein
LARKLIGAKSSAVGRTKGDVKRIGSARNKKEEKMNGGGRIKDDCGMRSAAASSRGAGWMTSAAGRLSAAQKVRKGEGSSRKESRWGGNCSIP